jgi:uncharacterized membrane protein YeaQ/YmgE (transglycosylase-associated protein family)
MAHRTARPGGGFNFIIDALIDVFDSVVRDGCFRLGVSIDRGLISSIPASIVGTVIVVIVIRLLEDHRNSCRTVMQTER